MSFQNDDNFDSESYVKVNTRLAEFWLRYPEGRLETECKPFGEGLYMIAKLYRERGDHAPSATGHAFLDNIYGDKVGEYTETVAVGRALALMGFQVEKSIASSEEMQRFRGRQDQKSEESKTRRELSDVPEVPKSLKPTRIFKPLTKSNSEENKS